MDKATVLPLFLLVLAGVAVLVRVMLTDRARNRIRVMVRSLFMTAAKPGTSYEGAIGSESPEAQLQTELLVLKKLVLGFCHDLRQPIQAASAYLMAGSRSTDPPGTGAIQGVRSSLLSIQVLVESMADAVRIDSGQHRVQSQPVPIADLCQVVADQFLPLALAMGRELSIRLRGMEGICLRSDPDLLQRILRNLLTNALCHSQTARIRLSAMAYPSGVRLAVVNGPPGIPSQERQRLIAVLQGALPSDGPSLQNRSGWGLSISRRLAGLIGARLGVSSHTSLGTVFFLELPSRGPHEL
jgi:signal transduction histidine kinase